MSLSPERAAQFTPIIDSILTVSDLNTITTKRIRLGLQAAIKYDIEPYKEAIKSLIMERFDKFNAEQNVPPPPDPPKQQLELPVNGHKYEDCIAVKPSITPTSSASPQKHQSSEELSDVLDDKPPKKKPKIRSADEDAKLAARLQAEEDSRARPTRGGANRKRVTTNRATPKKKHKSASKVKAEDDSDLNSSSAEEKTKKRNGAFHQPFTLSMPLSYLLGGETVLSRPQTVKKIWEYVKARDLQDPEDKRQIRCDEAMRAVFKQERVHMFTMNKILSGHLYPLGEE